MIVVDVVTVLPFDRVCVALDRIVAQARRCCTAVLRPAELRACFYYGLNLTSGMFLEFKHLSQHHSAYTSACIRLKAASVSPLQVR